MQCLSTSFSLSFHTGAYLVTRNLAKHSPHTTVTMNIRWRSITRRPQEGERSAQGSAYKEEAFSSARHYCRLQSGAAVLRSAPPSGRLEPTRHWSGPVLPGDNSIACRLSRSHSSVLWRASSKALLSPKTRRRPRLEICRYATSYRSGCTMIQKGMARVSRPQSAWRHSSR